MTPTAMVASRATMATAARATHSYQNKIPTLPEPLGDVVGVRGEG